MLVLGVPLALPLAVLAFLAGYIPYFGGIVDDGHHPARHARPRWARPGARDARADGRPQRRPRLRRPPRGLRSDGQHPPGAGAHRAAGRVPAGRHRRPVRGGPGDGGRARRGQRDGRHPGPGPAPAAAGPGARLARPRGPVQLADPRRDRPDRAPGRHPHRRSRSWSSRSSWPSSWRPPSSRWCRRSSSVADHAAGRRPSPWVAGSSPSRPSSC